MKAQYIRIDESGNKFYFSDKEMMNLHREDGPACEWAGGSKTWWINNERHREDGPAVEWRDGMKEWFRNGKHHRMDGPAIEYPTGTKYWFINGVELTEAQFKSTTAPHNGKKVTVDGVEYTLKA